MDTPSWRHRKLHTNFRLGVLACAGLVFAAVVVASEGPNELAAKAIVARAAYQKELQREPTEARFSLPDLPALPALPDSPPLVRLLRVVAIALGIGLAVIWLAAAISRRKFGASGAGPGVQPQRADSRKASGLVEVERLAALGLHSQAVHALLLLAVAHLSARTGSGAAASLTSRELTRVLPQSQEERDRFAHLVREAELAHFGGRDADDRTLADCLDAYRNLTS